MTILFSIVELEIRMAALYQLREHRWFERPDFISLLIFSKTIFIFCLFYAIKSTASGKQNNLYILNIYSIVKLRLTQSSWIRTYLITSIVLVHRTLDRLALRSNTCQWVKIKTYSYKNTFSFKTLFIMYTSSSKSIWNPYNLYLYGVYLNFK